MMNKIKYVLFGVIVTLFVMFIFGIINSVINMNSTIYVKEVPKFDEKIDTINKNIGKIKNEVCVNRLNTLVSRVKDTYYKKNISVKDYYKNYNKDDITFSDLFDLALSSCGVSSEEVPSIVDLVLSSRVYPDSVSNRYRTSYEFRITDFINKKSTYELSDEIGTYSSKENELRALNDLTERLVK